MGSYESMHAKLEPLHLYTLAQGGEVDCELKAYACGLDPLFGALDVMLREAFIATAESYGLSERERFLEKERSGLSVARRRELLTGYETENDDATADGFLLFLTHCGLEQATVSENPTSNRLSVYIADDLDAAQKSLIGEKIAKAAPSHLDTMIHFHDGTGVTVP